MRVRYTLPVRGTLRLSGNGKISWTGWTFHFRVNRKTKYVDRLVVVIKNVTRDQWPTMTAIKQDPNAKIPRFPFAVNSNVLRFNASEPRLINLESILSVFGLEAIEFDKLREEWLPEGDDERLGMQSGFTMSHQWRETEEPVSNKELAHCIVASNASESETAGLAHFRLGRMCMRELRFIEAIRHFYLCIEYLFANGKTKKAGARSEFAKSSKLTKVIDQLFFTGTHRNFEKIKPKYEPLARAKGHGDFLRFLVNLRGILQHANLQLLKKWHPSRQGQFEDEAICLMEVADNICFQIALAKMRAVPSSTI